MNAILRADVCQSGCGIMWDGLAKLVGPLGSGEQSRPTMRG